MKLLLFSALLSSYLLRLSSADDDPPITDVKPDMDCFPTSCGSVENISYPFWVENQQPPHCGFPSIRLTCKDNSILILEIPPASLQVKKIFYENDSLWLASAQQINDTSFCRDDYFNLSFTLKPFTISSVNKNLTFLFDCSEPPRDYYETSCGAYNGNRSFAYLGDRSGAPSSCKSTVVPVFDYWGANVSEYLMMLNKGFLVNWTVADCTDCRSSKGQCGYNEESESFVCICPDRAHSRMCTAAPVENTDKGSNAGKYIGIVTGATIILLVCLLSFLYVRRRKKLAQVDHLLEDKRSQN